MDVIRRNNVKVIGSQGPVLVFAHGFGCSQAMWSRVAPAFADTHRLVLFDYVGSGGSDLAAFHAERYAALGGYVQDLNEVCDALGLHDDITLVAHSVSCSIGWLADIACPGRFGRMLLLGPNPCFLNHPPAYHGGFEREDLQGLLDLMDQNYFGWARTLAPVVAGSGGVGALPGSGHGSASAELTDSFCATDPVAARAFARATFFADSRAALPRVRCPSLILQHRHDTLAPLAVADYLLAHLPGSQLQVLDVAGHCAHLSHPALVIDALRRYLPAALPAG